MNLTNYPDGVSGREYEIAGPDAEWEEALFCENCDKVTLFTCQSYQNTFSAACTICEHEHATWSDERETWEDGLLNELDEGEWDPEEDWRLEDGCSV
jgi:hypothetical protein